jgi:fructose-1,6-bisphosphatase I
MKNFPAKIVTIQRHIIDEERIHPGATGEFSALLRDLTLAIKLVWREVSFAGLVDILGLTGDKNIHGEAVKKLDIFANERIIQAMDHGGHLCGMASEESDGIIPIPNKYPKGKYILVFDPLDGSSNIDVNINIGTIFGIYKRISAEGTPITEQDFLQPGKNLLGAGYVIYGPSTVMVYSSGHGVHGFTLDPGIGEFLLSHENINIPDYGSIYSVNEGNYEYWDENLKDYIHNIKMDIPAENKPFQSRYIGSLVADFHRTLMYGGIFLYPKDKKRSDGKLRLLYELNPLAYLIEHAGGLAIDGKQNILDIIPAKLHQRSPVYTGSRKNIEELKKYLETNK